MRDRFRLIHLIWSLRVLLLAFFVFLAVPTPFDAITLWPLHLLAATLLLAAAFYAAWVRRPLEPVAKNLELNLSVLGAAGLAVKVASKAFPVLPVAFFILFPVSVFSRRKPIVWVPAALLAAMAAGRSYLSSDFDLVAWAAAFVIYCAVLGFTVLRERERYGRIESYQQRLREDARDMMRRIQKGDRLLIQDRRQHEESAAYGAVREQDQLLWNLVIWIRRVFQARTCLLFVPGEPGYLRIRAGVQSKGTEVQDAQVSLDKGILNLAAEREGVLVLGDVRARQEALPFYPKGVEVRSLMVKTVHDPSVEGSPLVGAIYLDSTRTEHFCLDEWTKTCLEGLSGLVVRSLSVSDQLRHVTTEMAAREAISRHARALTATLSPEVMAKKVLEAVFDVLPGCEASAFLLQDGELRVAACTGRHFSNLDGMVITPEEPSQIGLLLRQMESEDGLEGEAKYQIVHDVEKPRRTPFFVKDESIGHVASFAAVPCLQKTGRSRQLKGVLVAASSRPRLVSKEALKDLWTIADITAQAIDNAFAHRQVDELARIDGLTGLLNRRTFLMVLESRIGRVERYQEAFSMVMVDADHFKMVNDAHGHAVGDEVLRELARRLREGIREHDSVARFGGEEFAIILDKAVGKDARKVCEKLRKTIADSPIATKAGPLSVTVSIGYSQCGNGDALARQDLLDRADQALYHAKKTGRDRVVGYQELERVNRDPA